MLVRCDAEGHAGAAARGSDIVCAAVSVLMRSMARAVAGHAGINSRFSAPNRGKFSFSAEYAPAAKDYLCAAGTFLIEGIKSIIEEYPQHCSLHIATLPSTAL